MLAKIIENYNNFVSRKNNLDLFLLKGGILAALYFIFRILFRKVVFLKAILTFSKQVMINFLVKSSYWFLNFLGFDVQVFERIVYIEGSQGVRVINACVGWSTMALFIGFIIAYPGIRKSKYWYIPFGLIIIVAINILRISLMAIISYKSIDSLDFYHKYIFNFSLYVIVFALWILWAWKFNKKKGKDRVNKFSINK